MNYKKLFIASLICTSILSVSSAYSQELQAKVAKGDPVYKKYQYIDKMIEYNNYKEADAALRDALNAAPNDLEAKTLRMIWMAQQQKLAPARAELDKLLLFFHVPCPFINTVISGLTYQNMGGVVTHMILASVLPVFTR